jgi:hypothetical protein
MSQETSIQLTGDPYNISDFKVFPKEAAQWMAEAKALP